MNHSATTPAQDWYDRLGIGAQPRGVTPGRVITHSDGQEKHYETVQWLQTRHDAITPIEEAIETGQW